MALLAVCLCAIGMILFKPIPHATLISLWDGSAEMPLIDAREPDSVSGNRETNRITISNNDQILWDGEAVNHVQLTHLLQDSIARTPEPITSFEPDADASYDLTARVIQLLNRSGKVYQITGLEKYCVFYDEPRRHIGQASTLNIAHSITILPESDFTRAAKPPSYEACEKKLAIQGLY